MRLKAVFVLLLVSMLLVGVLGWPVVAQKPKAKTEPIPHNQTQMPGPALSPQEAIQRMKVPDGFTVELVASEPDLVNPVAMTFDERGRIWITESLEYPRSSAGPGRDRIKVLEDTDGDGKADKFTIFAEGLNIPSGIAVGHGGVWVANAPDILFLQDTDGDGKADRREVVVTGFGRFDTHELPNSLTWGPDGYLYGLNGVFNRAHVQQQGREFDFTCALFRIDPRTRRFELFAEGTSNPWGIAWDSEGSGFVSACVIDHLWHLTESGYYHRQGGPYPPFTWKIDSIVSHKHQKAAYCGIHYFDSDAYPPEYREQLYMGNIHGNCINSDTLTRAGSTYFARPRPDFLVANDQWFMPVVQKTGPDGCLYILDWYDRYHCYQDARRDPEGIDRLRGRLYRVRYKHSPRAPNFDLAKESDEQLLERLHSPNVYFRDMAQRLLCERNMPATRTRLEQLVLNDQEPRKARMHALWALVGAGALNPAFHQQLLAHSDPGYRAWGVRAAGNMHKVDPALRATIEALAKDAAPDVQLQVAIAARKIEGIDALPLLTQVLAGCGVDKLIPHIVWQNLHPLLEDHSDAFLKIIAKTDLKQAPNVTALMPRAIERIMGRHHAEPRAIVALYRLFAEGKNADPATARTCLSQLATRIQTGEINGPALDTVREALQPDLRRHLAAKSTDPMYLDAALLAASMKDPAGLEAVQQQLKAPSQPEGVRLRALEALIAGGDVTVLDAVAPLLADRRPISHDFRARILESLGRLDSPLVGDIVLKRYAKMEPDLQPRAIELLTQRPAWSKLLLQAIARNEISKSVLNVNHVRKLQATKDADLLEQVKKHWGTLREERNPEREKLVAEMRSFLRDNRGDPVAGQTVFKNICGQCHKIHGQGEDVGPDITSNGRASYDQLLSNIFDPSLVIGASYQATTVVTMNGRVLSGLVLEDNAQHLVLKIQGGKTETLPRGEIETVALSKVSLMPEGFEKQLKPQELADLFAFLALDKPPGDRTAKKIPGAPR